MTVETDASQRVPVSVITGFLGSGKTTLLNALLRHPRMGETAVLVNELGEVGIDHMLVEAVDEDVVLLDSGCLCCSVRDDLVLSLESLLERRRSGSVPAFRRVVVETTGLADPSPILHTLLGDRRLLGHCRIDGIVTTVDALNGAAQLSEFPEPVRQAAVADRIVITKTDLAPRREVETLIQRLRPLNPGAPIIEAVLGGVDPGALFDVGIFDPRSKHPDVAAWLGDEAAGAAADRHAHGEHRHDARIRAFSLGADAPVEIWRFVRWVEALLETHGERVLRLKGVLNAEGSERPVVVHGVRHVFHPLTTLNRWPDDDRRSRVVVIGADLDEESLRESFRRAVLERSTA